MFSKEDITKFLPTGYVKWLTNVCSFSARAPLDSWSWPPLPRAVHALRRCETVVHSRRIKTEERAKGRNGFNSMSHKRNSTRMICRNGWIEERTLGGMEASEKWMTIDQPPKIYVLPKRFPLIILAAFKYIPQIAAITFTFSSVCIYPSSVR